MLVTWDETKRQANLNKHGLDSPMQSRPLMLVNDTLRRVIESEHLEADPRRIIREEPRSADPIS